MKGRGGNRSDAFPGAGQALWLVLILPAVYLAAGSVQALLVELFPMGPWHLKLFSAMLDNGPASIAGLVLVAPFVEELLFRGIILRGFLRRYSRVNALLFSSIIFGAAHLNLYQFIGAGVLGLLLGWLYMHFRSILPGMFFHAIYNGAIAVTANAGSGNETSFFDFVPGYVWLAALPLLLPGAYALFHLARRAGAAAPA